MRDEDSARIAQRTDEDREFAAITAKEIFEEARDRLQIATEAYAVNRQKSKHAMEFRNGDQWENDISTSVSQDSPELTINFTDILTRRVINNIKQQRPRGKCHPVGDGADIELAELINGIGRHIETRSDASIAYDLAAERSIDAGEGYFRLIAEFVSPRSFQKDLRILPIRNIFTVSMDPSAQMPSGSDQNWCILSVKMKRQEYRRRYPNAKNRDWNTLDNDGHKDEWEDKEDIRLAEYFRILEVSEQLYMIRGPGGEEFTRYRSELPRDPITKRLLSLDDTVAMMAERGLKLDGVRDSVKREVQWFRLNGREVIERQKIPGTYIPVFRVDGNVVDIDGKIMRSGMVSSMIDPQRMVNYGEVAKIKRLGLAPKAPWIAAEGQLDGHPEWDDANQVPYSVLTYKPVIIETSSGPIMIPAPVRQPPTQIEAGFSDFVQGMKSNLLAIAGASNDPGQDASGEVVSGVALDKRQWLSDQSHFQYYDHLTQAIGQCWRVIVEWIPVYYSESRMQRIIGDDYTPSMVPINQEEIDKETGIKRIKNDLSVGTFDVVMETGPGYETKRQEGAENLIQLVKIPGISEIVAKVAPDLLFRSIDHPYMQELADRLMAQNPDGLKKVMEGMSSRARGIIQSLANENQQLKQQLQQMEADLKQGLSKAHIAAVTKVHDTTTKAQTALQIEEIRAAGKIIDSQGDRSHEAQMLEKELLHDAAVAGMGHIANAVDASADRVFQQQVAAQQPAGQPQNGA